MTTKKPRKYSQDFSGVSKTAKEFGKAADINNIVKAYAKAGISIGGPMDPLLGRKYKGQYGVEVPPLSYEEAMRQKCEVESTFNELPSHLKAEHENAAAWFDATINPEPSPEPVRAPLPEAEPISKIDDPIKGDVL